MALRILVFTTLFPSAVRPRHGIFVATRIAHMRANADIDVRVVAPVPWFPSRAPRFGAYAQYASTPRREVVDGIAVLHPRYLTLPGIGMYSQPWSLARAGAGAIDALAADGFDFDVIDAHYLYPDGVAAAMLSRRYGKPLVVTARGSDVNLLMEHALPRRLVQRALREANAVVAVSAALKSRLVGHGVDADRVHVLRNGVDTQVFAPQPRAEARASLGLAAGPLFAAVGNLVPEKGHDLVIDALAQVPDANLLLVGDGPERRRLEERARNAGLASRVRFVPVRPQRELAAIYSAADVVVLASAREGWPNVVLEAMACGTPVIATNVGGVGEIITSPVAGRIVTERSASALAAAMRRVLADPPSREAVSRYAAGFGWQDTAIAHVALCREAVAARARPRSRAATLADSGQSLG